nr:EPS15-like protein [Tanacetum cinerariifolium]
MSVRPTWRKKLNHCNSSSEVDNNLPTTMPKPQSPINEPTTHSNYVSLSFYSTTKRQSISTHTNPISLLTHQCVLHAQTPPSLKGNNHTQPPLHPALSREILMNNINQLQDPSNLLAMHLSQHNTPSSPYSPNLPHTLNLDQVEQHVSYCPQVLRSDILQSDGKKCIDFEYLHPPTLDGLDAFIAVVLRFRLRHHPIGLLRQRLQR